MLIPFFIRTNMLQKSSLDFLKKLRRNNNKEWMDANRAMYENARDDFRNLVEYLVTEIGKYDPDIAVLDPKRCIFRQNRDIRFSADKSPYKLAFGAFMNKGGKKTATGGYYIHAEPGNCFIAGGLWMPEKEELAKIRQEIDYNIEELNAIMNNRSFKKYFPDGFDSGYAISRPPKGYDETNPALPYLKLKSFTVSLAFTDGDFLDKKTAKEIVRIFKMLHPLVSFLNRALD